MTHETQDQNKPSWQLQYVHEFWGNDLIKHLEMEYTDDWKNQIKFKLRDLKDNLCYLTNSDFNTSGDIGIDGDSYSHTRRDYQILYSSLEDWYLSVIEYVDTGNISKSKSELRELRHLAVLGMHWADGLPIGRSYRESVEFLFINSYDICLFLIMKKKQIKNEKYLQKQEKKAQRKQAKELRKLEKAAS